jgi:hypothetical protein
MSATNSGEMLPPPSVADWQLLGSNELEGDRKVDVDRFKWSLAESIHDGIKVLDIDSLYHRVSDKEKAISQQMLKAVTERAGSNFYVSPEYGWLAGAGYSAFHVRRVSGAETSAHGVFFGVLHDPDNMSKGVSVAIKPCDTKPETAVADWVNNSLIHKQDDRTYEPIGFILDGYGMGYSITKFKKEGFDTLDSTTWNNVLAYEEDPAYSGQREVLTSVAEALASLHKNHIYHGDPQFKNIVVDITGDVYFIDWESAAIYTNAPEPAQMTHKMEHDLKVLFRSVAMPEDKAGVGLLDIFTDNIKWSLFKKYIFDPYMEAYMPGGLSGVGTGEGSDFMVIADIEENLRSYIVGGEIYASYSRTRHNNHK